jgi:cytosine deaminase
MNNFECQPLYRSEEERHTISRLHDMKMSDEVLSLGLSELVSVVSYRGDADKHLQLCARQMNAFMRENYKGFIYNCGRNIYPLIIASDYEPGFEGVGSTFTLYLRDGSQHKIAPTVSSNYEMFKALSHMSLCLFVILTPHFNNPKNISWKGKVLELKSNIENFKDALISSSKDATLKEQLLSLANIYVNFIDEIVKNGTFNIEQFLSFTREAFAKIRIFMSEATLCQARAILPAMIKWKKMLGPEEWSKVYVMIPTVWPVALNSPRLQLFERLIDPDKIATHLITSEFPRNFDECRDTVGRVVGDRTVGRLVFGTADTKAKMKVLALSSRTDVVADDFEINLQRVFEELDPMDAKFVNPSVIDQRAASTTASACPMNAVSSSNNNVKGKSGNQLPVAIRRAKLLNKTGLWDIVSTPCGRIARISNSSTDSTSVFSGIDDAKTSSYNNIDAAGGVVIPGFVDAHVHLDKCYLLDRCRAIAGDFPEALSQTLDAKRNFTVEDITKRARKLIEKEISFGTSIMRAHVEVDPIIGNKAVTAIIPLKNEYASYITIQVAVFAQEGITNQPGQVEMLKDALKMGCDVIASAPYCDPSPEKNIDIIFDLAKEFNVPVDFHLDYHLEGKPSLLNYVIEQTIKHGWQNKVCLGHMTYLSTLTSENIALIGESLKNAGISILALPASDICMMARADNGNRRRGVCPVHELTSKGACCAFATNNVQNLFTFTGDGDVLKVGTLLCQLLQLTSESGTNLALEMATTIAAKAIGVKHGLEVGNSADFVLLEGDSSMTLLASPPIERVVIKKGKLVSRSTYSTTLL